MKILSTGRPSSSAGANTGCDAAEGLWVTERRSSERYGLRLAISFRRAGRVRERDEVLFGETDNISTGGMYFRTAHSLVVNELIDFSLAFPELDQGGDVRVSGQARVLRVHEKSETASEAAGVAVVNEEYHIHGPQAAA